MSRLILTLNAMMRWRCEMNRKQRKAKRLREDWRRKMYKLGWHPYPHSYMNGYWRI